MRRKFHDFFFTMPYCISKLADTCAWIPLNRDYKLLGSRSKNWIAYENFADEYALEFDCDPSKLEIWHAAYPGICCYLYGDGGTNINTYYPRLRKLLDHARKDSAGYAVIEKLLEGAMTTGGKKWVRPNNNASA
jgi:hypothetical protein